jgi:ABC-type multidrug transport system fused ATPase/permease subunit
MDRIIVIDKGKIAEDGTHKQLLLKQGTYARLWNRQLKHIED